VRAFLVFAQPCAITGTDEVRSTYGRLRKVRTSYVPRALGSRHELAAADRAPGPPFHRYLRPIGLVRSDLTNPGGPLAITVGRRHGYGYRRSRRSSELMPSPEP